MRIEAADRAGRERLLRYCPGHPSPWTGYANSIPSACSTTSTKPGPGGSGPLLLTPLELIDRLAALVPPPRIHRHRYFGVLAPNSPLRAAVTALAPRAPHRPHPTASRSRSGPSPRRPLYLWALLLARLYQVFPLACPLCGAEMRIIAFITDGPTVRDILDHLGEPTRHPDRPARGPPLWEATGAAHDPPLIRRSSRPGLRVRPAPRW